MKNGRTSKLHTRQDSSMCYILEDELVKDFAASIKITDKRIQCSSLGFEFAHQSGRTDLIGVTEEGYLIAFEGKLLQWRKALDQARRNTSFAHYSYVLLPNYSASSAKKNREHFQNLGVGLVVMHNGRPKISIRARRQEPLMPWLTDTAKLATNQ